jgi:hypothetical protein
MVDWSISDAALLTVIAASIASAMLLAPLVAEHPTSEQKLLSTKQWRGDLRYLADHVPRVHPQFDAAVAQVDAKIPALSDHEIELELFRLVALLGEGHSRFNSLTLPNSGLVARIAADCLEPNPDDGSLGA